MHGRHGGHDDPPPSLVETAAPPHLFHGNLASDHRRAGRDTRGE